MEDPFAKAPADEAQSAPEATDPWTPPPAEEPKTVGRIKVDVKPNLLPLDAGKVVMTFKGGSGFDAPWIVIHATDLQDAYDQVHGDNASLLAELMDRTQKVAAHFGGLSSPAPSAAPQRQAAPPAAQQPPPGSPPCPGQGWVFKSGVSAKTGKPWQGWMPPRGSTDAPVFF